MLVVGLLALVIWLALSAVRLARAASSLREQQRRLEALLEAGILEADAAELEHIAITVRDDVGDIESVVGPFAPFGPYFGWLPVVGPLLADAGPLLDMADAGSEMAIYGLAVARPLLADNQTDGVALTGSLPSIVATLDQAERHLLRADLAAERLLSARAALENEDRYPGQLATLIARFDDNAGLLHDGLKLALVAPELLGFERPKTYLILAQNEDELRPTGGFISGAGLLTVDQGRIVSISFDNSYIIDDWQNKPYDLPPEPFTQFMGMDIFLFRDANFWPDFAESAAQAQALYTYGQNVPLDGVLAIDQSLLQQLLVTTGPLPVPELDRIVNAANVINQLREEWGPGGEGESWIVQRKAFMGPLAAAFLVQWGSDSLSFDAFDMVTTLQRAAQQRHLQLYSADPDVASVLNKTAWSGRLGVQDGGDFLHVSDTNMGFNKVNATVQRSLAYRVNLDEAGGAVARLDIHYRNPATAEAVECQHGTSYDPDTQYEALTSDCYWNYLRAYVPGGSELITSSQHPVAATDLMSGLAWPGIARTGLSSDGSLAVFDNFVLLRSGQEITVTFQYTLPDAMLLHEGSQVNYRLYVRKQAGMTDETVSVQITLPEGASLREVTPQPVAQDGNAIRFELRLENDAVIEVEYVN